MKIKALIVLIILIYGCDTSKKTEASLPPYPQAPSTPVVEDYFGTTIEDDYRNLENLKDSLTLNWFKEESEYAKGIKK